MIDMNVQETYDVINAIERQPKHFEKGLFYKLQYVYARRSDEIANLKVEDLDFENGCIKFHIAKKRSEKAPTINLNLFPELTDEKSEHPNKISYSEPSTSIFIFVGLYFRTISLIFTQLTVTPFLPEVT